MQISYLVYQFFNIVVLIMLIRVFLSWIPSINWYKEPYFSIKKFTDFIFEPFRRIIPPVGMFDFSAILAFFAIYIIQAVICNLLRGMGL